MAKNKYLNREGLAEVANFVNEKLKKVTTMPASPNVNDIVLYNGATTASYKQGGIYLYQTVQTYYAWTDLTDTYYTEDPVPEVGDTVYSDAAGTDSGFIITAYDSTNNQVTINSLIYDRDSTGDTDVYDWVYKGGTSVILNGENKVEDEANFYAPTEAGVTGQVLISKGEKAAPKWASFSLSGYAPSFLETSLLFTYGLIPEVENNSLIFDLDDIGT